MSLQSLCLRAIIAHDFGDESPEQAVLAAIICESHLGLRAPLLEVLASPDAFARLSTLAVLREAFLSDLLARPKAGAARLETLHARVTASSLPASSLVSVDEVCLQLLSSRGRKPAKPLGDACRRVRNAIKHIRPPQLVDWRSTPGRDEARRRFHTQWVFGS